MPPAWSVRYSSQLLLTVVLVAAGCGAAPSQAPRSFPFPVSKLQQLLQDHAEQFDSGTIALVERDGQIWRGAAGRAEGEHQADPHQADPGDRFVIGSIDKTFLATVALQLVEEGRLSLDGSIDRWVPVRGGRVLVRHLLNHTHGMYALDHHAGYAVSSAIPPGTTWRYSNRGYFVLHEIVEAVTGRPAGQEMRDRILIPLDLADTRFGWGAISKQGPALGPHPPAHGMVSTTSDLARFFQALLRGELIGEEMLAEMTQTVPAENEFHAGLGLFRADLGCGSAWGNGGAADYVSQVLASRDGSTVLVAARYGGDWPTVKSLAEGLYCLAI
jgi:D-alanyl-D-alanine carboxypeptidase